MPRLPSGSRTHGVRELRDVRAGRHRRYRREVHAARNQGCLGLLDGRREARGSPGLRSGRSVPVPRPPSSVGMSFPLANAPHPALPRFLRGIAFCRLWKSRVVTYSDGVSAAARGGCPRPGRLRSGANTSRPHWCRRGVFTPSPGQKGHCAMGIEVAPSSTSSHAIGHWVHSPVACSRR
jgi:hypothetical protein